MRWSATQLQIAVKCLLVLLTTAPALGADDRGEFRSLFLGDSLDGWDGDPRFWRVEDGAIVGETTAAKSPERNTFLICRQGEFADFELRFQFQVRGYNSGVQYRSVDLGDWNVRGYQADFEDRWHAADSGAFDRFSGMFFEENGRMFLAQRGEVVVVRAADAGGSQAAIERLASLGDPKELEGAIHRDGWNEYRVVAAGFQFTHIINGRVMAIGFDEDLQRRRESGLIAFQLHAGPPMRIRVKDVEIRVLPR